jgi:hypothetical protein
VKKTIRASSMPTQTGTASGAPSGLTVATWAKFARPRAGVARLREIGYGAET